MQPAAGWQLDGHARPFKSFSTHLARCRLQAYNSCATGWDIQAERAHRRTQIWHIKIYTYSTTHAAGYSCTVGEDTHKQPDAQTHTDLAHISCHTDARL